MSLTSAEKKLVTAIGFDAAVCEIVKGQTRGRLKRLTAFTEDFKEQETDGLAVAVEREQVEPVVAVIQPKIAPRGYRAFWSETYTSNGAKESDVVAILKTTDHYSILSIRRPSGGNYGVSAKDVVKRLRKWEQDCQFQIAGAGGSWVAIQFESLPKNICAFAEEIYDFCPDTVEQGVGLMNERDHPEAFAAARDLCPKLSVKLQKKLDREQAKFAKMDLPPELAKLLESNAGGFATPTDMGIRLLANELKQSRSLFLWWD